MSFTCTCICTHNTFSSTSLLLFDFVLFVFKGLRVQPEQACSIVVACVVLHNLGIERQDIVDIPPVNRQIVDEVALPAVNGGRNEGKAVRDHIAQTFFAN